GAVVRLDDEIAVVAEDFRQPPQLRVVADRGVHLWRRHADALAQVAHAQLVVHDGEQRPRVVVEDAGGVAAVHAEDAQLAQAAGGAEQPKHDNTPKNKPRITRINTEKRKKIGKGMNCEGPFTKILLSFIRGDPCYPWFPFFISPTSLRRRAHCGA